MSTHKTLPTLTQTGLLHVNDEYYEKVINYLQMFQTSSPSYLLMSSIDSCLSKIRESGSKLWEDFFRYRDAFTKRMEDLKHLKYIETDDPCKIVISTDESSSSLDDDFARSEKRLNDSGNLEGVPVIGKLLKGKGALFCCVAIIFIIGFYVIFFKKNDSNNS